MNCTWTSIARPNNAFKLFNMFLYLKRCKVQNRFFPPRYVQIVSEQWIIDQCVFSNMSRVQGTNDTTYWILSCVNQPKCNNRNQIPFQCGVAVEDRCTDFSVPPERSSVCSVRGRPEITGYEIRRKISCHCWIRSCQICQLLDERSAGPFFGG